jgi:enoyl-CoA hydratase/carnithine racemase
VVTLDRPPANTISAQVLRELEAALGDLAADDAVRAVVVTGAGDRIFCGGADLTAALAGEADGDIEGLLRRGHALLRRIETSPKPVIAAIQGHATGGGCELAMACQLRIMKEGARIGLTESGLGIIPGWGGTQRLPRLVGRTRALELLILGSQITAREALAMGLVNRVAPEGQTLEEGRALARAIAGRAPVATRLIIECVDRGLSEGLAAGSEAEIQGLLAALRTEDAAEGILAFLQKRPASFTGR